jgi:transcriptional regulator with XRE-family HTH domain
MTLKERREALQLTQDDVTAALGCSSSYYPKLERDNKLPLSKHLLAALARVLKTTVKELTHVAQLRQAVANKTTRKELRYATNTASTHNK